MSEIWTRPARLVGICAAALSSAAGVIQPPIIPYGMGEGDFGTNGVGQTRGVVPNPLAGDFRWGWQDPYPGGTPAGGWFPARGLPDGRVFRDEYKRFVWRALERVPGVYDFSLIEQHLQQAANAGRRFAFRVMILSEYEGDVDNDGQPDGKLGAPSYIESAGLGRRMPSTKPECDGIFVPHWNDPAFLAHVEALVRALGTRFDGDPRLAYVDIGIYGHWGEWHMSGLGFATLPAALNATPETRARLVDIFAAAFPTTRLLMIPDTDGDFPDRSGTGFVYAMERHPRIGVRKDNLGNIWFEQEVGDWFANIRDAFHERWTTAPLVTEFFGGEDDAALARAESQVIRYHVSMVAANQWLESTQRIEIGKAAGFRFQLNRAEWPAVVPAGHRFQIVSRWSNVGVAPAYERWAPTWELYDANSQRVWSARSRLDLRRLLPTTIGADDDVNTEETEAQGSNAPVVVIDELAVPSNLPPGTYTLRLHVPLIATDGQPHPYLPPLALATQGRDAQGRYPLGSLTVSAPAVSAPTVSLTPPSVAPRVGVQSQLSASTEPAAVTRVELLVNGEVVSTDTLAPYVFSWTPATAGGAVLVARATDANGSVSVSPPLALEVGPSPNRPPTATLSTLPPTPPSAPATLTVVASDLADPDGDAIVRVEFYRGRQRLGQSTAPPHQLTTTLGAGTHTLIAKVFDEHGAVGWAFRTVEVVNPPKGPYGGTARQITQRIELEDYDLGGEGISWWDSTPANEGGAYRNDSVDIQPTNDEGGGFHIAWVNEGEWLEFTVDVRESNEYHLRLRLASPPNVANPVVSVAVDGQSAWPAQVLPKTGRWDWDFENWQTWQSPQAVRLAKGRHVLRITFGAGMANYNWISFIAARPQTSAERFADWAFDFGLQDERAHPSADPDQDTLPNLLEYAFGTPPNQAGPYPPLRCSVAADRLRLSFTPHEIEGLKYWVEASHDLRTWLPGVDISALLVRGQPHTYVDTADLRAVPRRFLRLRVDMLP
ncbi:MAG: DUF5010 C-terminal domain-containing protein [Kiritimatiellae bacterium]|nr:DUF5010 C-terminal domain-containing protein [Kiritimatiellia bacterium]